MPMIDASVVKICWEGMMWEEDADAGTFWGRKRCGEECWGEAWDWERQILEDTGC